MFLLQREAVGQERRVVHRGAAQQRLDGALGLGVGQVPAAEQRAVVDQRSDEVEQLLAVGVCAQIPAGDCPVEGAKRTRVRLDPASVALSVAGMLALVYGLQELAAGQETGAGSTWPNLAVAASGLLVLTVFVRRQRRLSEPLFDLSLLANRRTAVSLTTLPVVGIGVTGLFYLFTQYLQWVAGLSPLEAALWTMPFIAINILGAMIAPP